MPGTLAIPEPDPAHDLVIAASTKSEFLLLLSRIGKDSKRSGGQIQKKSELARATVYRMMDPKNKSFPRNPENVEKYCYGCNLSREQIRDVVALWHTLDGRTVTVRGTGVILDAELVDMDEPTGLDIVKRTPPTLSRSDVDAHDDPDQPSNINFGNIKGNVTINVSQREGILPSPSSPMWKWFSRLTWLGLALGVAATAAAVVSAGLTMSSAVSVRFFAVVIVALVATIVALVAVLVSRYGGDSWVQAVQKASIAFGATMALLLTALNAVVGGL